jgi:hypothetical protein
MGNMEKYICSYVKYAMLCINMTDFPQFLVKVFNIKFKKKCLEVCLVT